MERSYVAENEVERARLKAIVARLTDADLANMAKTSWLFVMFGESHVKALTFQSDAR